MTEERKKYHLSQEFPEVDDPRRLLLKRLLASPQFVRSGRLSSFLAFICVETLSGRQDQINEQSIGEQVFERRAGYDPGQDNIVRSHATRLRQKLDSYFEEVGSGETIRITIPRGHYVPVFEPVKGLADQHPPLTSSALPAMPPPPPGMEPTRLSRSRSMPTLSIALLFGIACTLIFLLGRFSYAHWGPLLGDHLQPPPTIHSAAAVVWNQMFEKDQPTLIVAGDSGLVLKQLRTGKAIDLDEYVNGHERPQLSANPEPNFRFTSVVDLDIVAKLMHLPEAAPAHVTVRFARDIRLDDLKNHNSILIGASEANPWVGLYEKQMNFILVNQRSEGAFVVRNREPLRGEEPIYTCRGDDPQHLAYGVVALLPSLSGSDRTLIVEGTTMAGTEAASDMVFDGTALMNVLKPHMERGKPIPFFEVLLETNNIGGSAPRSRILAVRLH